jgi:uncharacterized protein YprB with RNaseH-like and TPR domain
VTILKLVKNYVCVKQTDPKAQELDMGEYQIDFFWITYNNKKFNKPFFTRWYMCCPGPWFSCP